jgi:hypothetical protein
MQIKNSRGNICNADPYSKINKSLLLEMHGYAIIGCVLNSRSLVFSYLWLNISNFLSDTRHKTNNSNKDQNFLTLEIISIREQEMQIGQPMTL